MANFTRRSILKSAGAASVLPLIGGPAWAADPLKVAFVYLGPVGDHGWTYSHEQARLEAVKYFGDAIVTTAVENVAEGADSERIIRGLAQRGNDLIITTSFGYMKPTLKVAKQFKNVKFEHATGYMQSENVSSYNARFYQGRAVCGTIAGHMSKTGRAGYIASFPIPQIFQDVNAFTLAARKVNPDFETRVIYVNSWYDPPKEADAAKVFFGQGADILALSTDSPAGLQVAEQRGLMGFGFSWDMSSYAPNAHLTSVQLRWESYYIDRIKKNLENKWSTENSWWGLKEGTVELSAYNSRIPGNVRAAANATRDGIIDGSAPVFSGPIKDTKGVLRVKAGETIDDATLAGMDWFVEGVLA